MSFLDSIAAGLSLVGNFEAFAALFVGVLIGTIAGAIPGMSATMAVALTLPFTFAMEAVPAILLLLGVYKGGIFGGCIPAILIKTPGTPASSATVLDGYPMAEKGQAGKALGMALWASCTADLISNLSLILFAGWLASFALNFGPPEFFTLILFSLTIIAGVSGNSLLKGALSAMLGLLLATVGLDLVYGTNRLTFGDPNLMGGLNFIAVLIGLFAMPEVMSMVWDPKPHEGKARGLGNDSVTFGEYKRCFRTIVRGSFIGVFLGSIPGIGAAPAAFLSYSEARRKSPNKANFGKGEVEGVAASESGNNGVAGATLIPLLALGVPGDVITAIIIGAFMIHGLQPGPMMFVLNKDLIYGLFIGLIVSSVFLFFIGSLAIRLFKYVADIPRGVLFPGVLVLCIYGVFAVNNNIFDVGVMFVMGWVGYVMLRNDIPAAPFLIAFILGPLLENNFRQAMLMSGNSPEILFRGPITWFFWFLTLLTVAAIIRAGIRATRNMRSKPGAG
ncbi:tripartite tricarboxylate transporter permease [Sulfitobacter sp. PR48]|jgi:putative tricarboxylic transport membrane protein|uniref:Tripartite tricarboxylate transporter permease n=1 Tax=Sulfitobacter porphyrae TaxID=1246864 RepID=A0ABW2AZQ3_9RHOB|nr:tripartite tricarboxylate transporter permease [Sulfitobacter sp. PR48]MDD9722043.1 tripartite tricarboxylate transporter permease [Sulfitobacter sp. PR48]GLT09140.1 C4-dicarboxylate ABC transporter permease [Sulfitobacter porphyrae]